MWLGKHVIQGEKNAGGKGREGSFQAEQHPSGFIGNADDIISSTEPGVEDYSQVLGGNIRPGLLQWGQCRIL